MFPALIGISAAFEASGVAGVVITRWPSLSFFLALHALELGGITALVAFADCRRRQSVDSAFDLGVEVGERRGRRIAKPVVLHLPERERV